MTPNLLRLGVFSATISWTLAGVAQVSDTSATELAGEEPTVAPTRSSLIVPLAPPDTLTAPATGEMVFGDFRFEEDRAARSLDVMLRSMFESHRVSGPGRAASFLEPGNHWLTDVEVNARSPVGEHWNTEFNAVVRYTDSRRHDPATTSVQYLQFIAQDEQNHLTLGDYYATFSQYSLNRGIKGVGYQRVLDASSHVQVVAGAFDPRWDYLFGTKADEPIDRQVIGLRVQTVGERYRLGLNLVNAQDDDSDPVRTTEDTYRQTLPAVDWEYRTLAGWRLGGEHAHARTRRQAAAGSETDLAGSAHRLNFDGGLGELRLRGRAERVSPDFFTMGGGAAIDRFRTYLRGDYSLTDRWGVFAATDSYRNNLDDRLDTTTRTRIPELGLTARGLFDRRSLYLSASYRQRTEESDGPQPQQFVSDRIYASVSDRFEQVAVRGEMEALLNEREGTTENRNDDFLYRFTVDSRHSILGGRYDLRPYLSLERQELEDPTTGATVRTDGVRFDAQLLTRGDLSYGFSFEDRATDNGNPGADDTRLQRLALNVDSRPAFLHGGTFRAEVGDADYDFSDDDRDYRERYLRLMLDFPFGFGS